MQGVDPVAVQVAQAAQAWAWWRRAKLRPHSGQAHMPVIDPPPEIQAANGTG